MSTDRPTLTGGTMVAAAMMVSNLAVYGFSVAAARLLVPADLGAVTALLGILLMGNVVSLGLQAATARRLSVSPEHADQIISVVLRVMLLAGCAIGLIIAVSTFVLTPALKLDSHWEVVWCGAILIPLTVMGGGAGIAQGTGRWRTLSLIYVANGVGRLSGGVIALLIHPSALSAMVGIAVGSLLPVLAALPVMRSHGARPATSRRPFITETFHGTHALLAYFVLSSLDALIARNRFDEHTSGLYAAGLILTKAALFAPQFVSVVLFPDLARATGRTARRRAVTAVIGIGALAVLATFALQPIALILVGGEQYGDVQGRLWLFALSGSVLAVVHLLVFDSLARHSHGVTALLWSGSAVLIAIAFVLDLDLTGLVIAVTGVAATIAAITWFRASSAPARPPAPRVQQPDPAP